MSITLKEIKDAACGADINGKGKSIVIVGAHRYNTADTTEDPKVLAEYSSLEPIVNIQTGGEITWINFKFKSETSADLSLFFRTFERYLEDVDNNTEISEAIAFTSIIPIELAGNYYINALHPIMWAVEPDSIGSEYKTLRIAFFSEDVSFLQSDLNEGFFEQALKDAEKEYDNTDYSEPYDRYGQSERDMEFTDSSKYISDLASDDEDDDDEDDDEDEDDEDEDPYESNYIYH